MTTRLLTVLVVSLLVLAGCLGGGPAVGDGTDADDGGAAPADRDDLRLRRRTASCETRAVSRGWSYSRLTARRLHERDRTDRSEPSRRRSR